MKNSDNTLAQDDWRTISEVVVDAKRQSEESAMRASKAEQYMRRQESYVQTLFEENEKLRKAIKSAVEQIESGGSGLAYLTALLREDQRENSRADDPQ